MFAKPIGNPRALILAALLIVCCLPSVSQAQTRILVRDGRTVKEVWAWLPQPIREEPARKSPAFRAIWQAYDGPPRPRISQAPTGRPLPVHVYNPGPMLVNPFCQ